MFLKLWRKILRNMTQISPKMSQKMVGFLHCGTTMHKNNSYCEAFPSTWISNLLNLIARLPMKKAT
jgi:hypothetical protein